MASNPCGANVLTYRKILHQLLIDKWLEFMDMPEDSELIETMQRGELDKAQDAFSILYDRYSLQIVRFLAYLGLTPDEQQEVTQETWVRVWKGRHSYIYQGIPVMKWIIAIAKNVARELWRYKSRKKTLPEDSQLHSSEVSKDDPIFSVIISEKSENIHSAVKEALRQATEDQRKVFEARLEAGLNSKETAELYGWSVSKVDTTLFRTLRFLRDYIIRKYGKEQVSDWLE